MIHGTDAKWSIFQTAAAVGRRTMMDFGLQGILDRIERDFGSRWARSLTILIALAICAACFMLIGNFLATLAGWYSSIPPDPWLGRLWTIVQYAAGLAFVVLLGNNLVTGILTRRMDRLAKATFDEAQAELRRVHFFLTALEETKADASKRLDQIEQVLAELRQIEDGKGSDRADG